MKKNITFKLMTGLIAVLSIFFLSACIPTTPVIPVGNPGAGDPTKGALSVTLRTTNGTLNALAWGTYTLEFYKAATDVLVVSKTEVFAGQPKVYNPSDAGDFYIQIKDANGNYLLLTTAFGNPGYKGYFTITPGEETDITPIVCSHNFIALQ